jgi:hypothetical protein
MTLVDSEPCQRCRTWDEYAGPVLDAEGIQMEYRYRIKYRHPRSGAVGIAVLNTAAEMAAERSRLETLGYAVIEVLLPIGVRPKLPPISHLDDPRP